MMNLKKTLVLLGSIFAVIVLILSINTYINNEISIKTQELQESHAKEMADIKLKLEIEKNTLEKQLKSMLIDIESELETCRVNLQTIENKILYKEMAKKDPKSFNKKINSVLGVKDKNK